MLSEREKHGVSELLDRMPTRDLMSLTQSVTSNPVVTVGSNTEAINLIIQHTERPQDLLKRRKIKKEFLLKYLSLKRVHVEASDDKADAIQAVCQVWGGSSHAPGTGSSSGLAIPGVSSEEDSLPEAPAPSRNTSYSSLCSLDLYGGASSSGPNGPSESGAGGQAALSLLRGVLGKLPINNVTNADGEGSSPPALRRSDSFAMDEDFEEDEQLMIIGGGGGGHAAVTAARSNTPSSSVTGCDEDDHLAPLHPIPGANPAIPHRDPFRLSQSLTPTPPLGMAAAALAGPTMSQSFQPSFPIHSPLRNVHPPHHQLLQHAGAASAEAGAAHAVSTTSPLLLSSSAPSSYFYHHAPRHLHSSASMSPTSSGSSPTSGILSATPLQPPDCLEAQSNKPSRDSDPKVAAMAESFVKWYYELLNATFFSGDGSGDFGPQHFWSDASAKIFLHQGSDGGQSNLTSSTIKGNSVQQQQQPSESICVQGDSQVCDALKRVARVTYHPNMADSVGGYVDVHGQAVLQAAGALLNPTNSAVCGTFQQQFGLVRDPSQSNNWKIKFTNASLVSKPESAVQPSSQFHAPASFDQGTSSSTSAMALS